MRPEWEAMKRSLSPGSKVVEVDGSEMSGNEKIGNSPLAGTNGFPEILKMRKGRLIEKFSGQRTAQEMKKFAEMGMKPKSKSKSKKTKKNKKNKTRKRKTGKRR
jgi:hypothetical protein